jgi:methionine synthase II (cobalamin-independent)
LQEVLSLAKHGCQYIQIDEPVLMRYPEKAHHYGVTDVARCFKGKYLNFF